MSWTGGNSDTTRAPSTTAGAHPHADPRDTAADLSERAQAISQEASGRVTAAMRDALGMAAGLAGFAVESARDLVQYLVRRGQMTAAEADDILRDVEAAEKQKTASRPRAESGPSTANAAPAQGEKRARKASTTSGTTAKRTEPKRAEAKHTEPKRAETKTTTGKKSTTRTTSTRKKR